MLKVKRTKLEELPMAQALKHASIKQILAEFEKRIRKGYGKRCKIFVWPCGNCLANRLLDDLKQIFE